MSEKYFWREKNADKFIGKCQVIKPTKSELENEISAKFTQKIEKIVYIFDKNKRNAFLVKTDKPPEFDFSDMSEKEIRRLLAKSIIVDLVQLSMDACTLYNLAYTDMSALTFEILKDEKTICKQLSEAATNIKQSPTDSIFKIQAATLSLAKLLDVDMSEVESLRAKKELEQGNFLNGKYVIK